MSLKRIDYSHDMMLLLARMLSVYAVSCVHQTNSGIVKSWLDENLQIHDDGKVSTDYFERRNTNTAKRTSWETTGNRDSMLFDDQNLTLCIRIQSGIDNLYDLYFATIRPTLGSLKLMVSDSYETQVSVRDKEIIATMCYSSCMALAEILKSKEEKTQLLMDDIRHKDKTITSLKREMEIPAERTRKIVKEKLTSLGKQYGKDFTLTKDAENLVDEYAGDNIAPLLKALEHTAALKAEIYDCSQIDIDNTDIRIKAEQNDNETAETPAAVGVREKRHARLIGYLEKLERAYNDVVDSGQKPTAINIANEMQVSSASITMWFNNHSEDARRLCEADINLCKNSRRFFDPLKEALAGRKNKSKTA